VFLQFQFVFILLVGNDPTLIFCLLGAEISLQRLFRLSGSERLCRDLERRTDSATV